jgi:hypothetical protein
MTKLNWMTKEELRELRRGDRAVAFLDSPAGRQFLNNLDALGWMVVQRSVDNTGDEWPVPLGTRAKWPSWCNHEFSATEIAKRERVRRKRSKLRLVEKPDKPT